jgi:H-NS histone family protein
MNIRRTTGRSTADTASKQFVEWEYQKIVLGDHRRQGDDIDLLCELGENGWELVAITLNNVAYLKREIGHETVNPALPREEAPSRVEPKYREPQTGETWSGRGRMAAWLKLKQDAGEDIEKYRIERQ